VIHHETSPTRRNEAVFALNPLGKVPVLIRDDGRVLFDSNVICEYFDGLDGKHRLIPPTPRRACSRSEPSRSPRESRMPVSLRAGRHRGGPHTCVGPTCTPGRLPR